MKPIWSTLYDDVKDRRYGALFLLAPLSFGGALGLAALLLAGLDAAGLLPYALCGSVVLVGPWIFVAVRRARSRQHERWERHELSYDEWRVARSKLTRDQDRKSA